MLAEGEKKIVNTREFLEAINARLVRGSR